MTNYWWVNQNQSFEAERREGILWAPYFSKDGRTRQHWRSMDDVLPGDAILHFAGQRVRAISRATTSAIRSRRPPSLPTEMWEQDGRLVRTVYSEAAEGIHRSDIPTEWRLGEPSGGPFQVNAGVKVGYLFPITSEFYEAFTREFGERFPHEGRRSKASYAAPAEALTGAADLLRRLVGVPLTTVSGGPNLILGIGAHEVLVRTERSVDGQNVPIAEVQLGLDQLIAAGQIGVHPDDLGYRSAFVGAVLRTLPGVSLMENPPRLILDSLGLAASDDDNADEGEGSTPIVTFQGDLSSLGVASTRREQASLRRLLFGAAEIATCALCGDALPVRFLWAAHIKKRAVCTDEERRDLNNVAMAACIFGCDALYEMGYISVDESGKILVSDSAQGSALRRRLDELKGRGCTAFTDLSAAYFAWHRENLWRSTAER